MMTAVISVIDSEIKENWQTKYQNILYQKIERFRLHVLYVNPEICQNPYTDTASVSQKRLTDGHQLRFCSSWGKKSPQNPKTTAKTQTD